MNTRIRTIGLDIYLEVETSPGEFTLHGVYRDRARAEEVQALISTGEQPRVPSLADFQKLYNGRRVIRALSSRMGRGRMAA